MLNKLKLLFLSSFLFATLATPTSAVEAPILPEFENKDQRVELLEAYLESQKSPMSKEASNFIKAADKYNLDWKLVPSITGVESTFGKRTPGSDLYPSYNGWGWGVYGTQALYFKSWREGIFTVSEGLKKNYVDKGLKDPYQMNRIYAASPTWGYKVTYFMADIEKFANEYKKQNLAEAPIIYTDPEATVAGTSARLLFRI